ncbi:hypothetical protein VTJ04DRAFT_2044 [Mycothermus thermophilus]|uniref:uncharacterized protein n=1 Tax=Humicola insolens TaxID=85995 RepID=UPI00374380BF
MIVVVVVCARQTRNGEWKTKREENNKIEEKKYELETKKTPFLNTLSFHSLLTTNQLTCPYLQPLPTPFFPSHHQHHAEQNNPKEQGVWYGMVWGYGGTDNLSPLWIYLTDPVRARE